MTETLSEFHSDPQLVEPSWTGDSLNPPPVYLVRHKNGLTVHSGASDVPHFSVEDEVFQSLWSPDGLQLVINGSSSGVVVYRHPLWNGRSSTSSDSVSCLRLARFPNSPAPPPRSLRHLQWSPKGSFVVAFWQYDTRAASAGLDDRNVIVWKTPSVDTILGSSTDIQPVAAFILKGVAMGQWPILKWRNDEKFCLLSSRSEVVVFDGSDVGGSPLMRIPLSGVISTEPAPVLVEPSSHSSSTSISPDGLIFAAFSPASSPTESDALFRVLVVPEVRRKSGLENWQVSVQKPLGSSDSADVTWSPSGTSVLVLANTTVDAAGENYGGVGDVYLARFDGSLTVKVNKAVAQEACWNPCRDEFVVIEGKSPSEMYLYDKDCNAQHEFPVAYRNTIRWDCFGLMVALGGFGNLAGDLSFWFRDTESRSMRLVADWREPCTVLCGWAPNGRHFYTASTFPRMKVDNHFKVFNYEGNLLTMKTYPQLLDFQWKPELPGTYSVPPRPTPQTSSIAITKKFKSARETVVEPAKAESRRIPASKNRKEAQSIASSPSATPATPVATPTAKTVASTVPTAAQAAKMERNRQLDSISDWRAAPKESEPSVSGETTQPKRRGSTTKSKCGEEKNLSVTDQPAASSDDTKLPPHQRRNNTDGIRVLPCRGGGSRDDPVNSGASSKPRSGAVTPSEPYQSLAAPATGQEVESRPLSPLARDFIMPSVPGSQQKRSGLAAETGDVGGSLPIHPDPLYQQIPPSPLTQTSTFQHPSQSSTNSSPAPPQQPADNSMGLLGILKSILPPDASVHLSREAPGRGNPVDYNADFPSLDNGQHTHVYRSQPNSLEPEPAAHESPTSFPPPPPPPFTGQWPSAGKAFSAPPQGTSDGVESLVNLLVRAQKEKMAQQKQQAPQPAVGWQQQDLSYVDRVRLDQSSATSSQKEQLLDVLLRVQQQQQYQLQRHLPTLESNLAAMGGTRDPLFGAYGESPANAQLIQQLQNRLRQSRGDSQQQALTLQTLLQLQQQKKPQQLLIGSPRGQNLDGCHSEWPMGQIMPQRIEPSIPPINVQRPVSRVDPTSDRCWEYLDPKGVVRGPFDINDMRKWCSMGYFEPSLPIRCKPTEIFTPLCRLFPPGTAFGISLPGNKQTR